MQNERTVQVTINLTVTDIGAYHWFVTTSEELQTVTWADDGSVEDANTAISDAIKVATNELRHVALGGAVNPTF